MRRFAFLLILILSSYIGLFADGVKFTSSLQRNPVVQGERFAITFTLHNAQGTRFTPPSFRGFTTLMGPQTQQSTQIINGAMSSQISYSYVLQAESVGNFTIGPATITVDGSPVKSNSVTVNVLEPSQAEKQQREQAEQQEQSLSKQARDVISKNLFVTLSVSKTSAYVGEQISATYKIFVHPELNVQNLTPKKEPSFNGFWTQQFDLGNVTWQNEVHNGVMFRSAVIKKVVLIPQQSGNLVIEPYQFDCVARLRVQGQQQRRRSIFDDFFDGGSSFKDFNYVATSSKYTINVKSLPKPQPLDFNGAVGKISMDAWIDKPKTKAGEPISLKVKISGSGNLKLIEPMELNFPPDFDVYDPKVADNVNVSANGVQGSKIFEYLLIPKHEGDYRIDPVSFSYFDLDKKDYVTLTSKEFNIEVGKGDGSVSNVVSGVQKEDIKFLGKDIRYIKENTSLELDRTKFFGSAGFLISSFLPFIIFIAIIIYKKKRDELVSNEKLMKNRQATKVARKRLVAAKKLLEQNNREKFFEEISRALWGYVSDKLGIPVSELSKDSAIKSLEKINIDTALIQRYMNTIDESEFARFAPSTQTKSIDEMYKDAVAVITEMEGLLK